MSISSIQSKYPSAIWYDSNHGGTNSGTLDNPYTSLSTAFNAITSNANVIAILNGTHTGTINTPSTLGGTADTLTLVGESTSAVLSGVLNKATGYDLKLETLKFYNDGSSAYAISLLSNTSTFEGCVLDNNRASSSLQNTTHKGFFEGNNVSIITCRKCVFSVGAGNLTYYGTILGGSANKGFSQATFEHNTIETQGANQLISYYNPSLVTLVFKNNIISGSGYEYIRYGNAATNTETISYNCYFNTATTTGNARDTAGAIFADPQFVDSPNGDYRLRPSSPCINAGTAS